MEVDPSEQWASVELGETLVGRRAGGSAAQKARSLRSAEPIRTLLGRFLGIITDERAPRRGANGERAAGWWLGRLPAGWHVFHDVRVGDVGANIDHLVVAPAGVFTIDTKNLTGKVWVGPKSVLHNRRRTDFLPKALAEARRASQLLSTAVGRPVEVRGALAILADDWTIKQRPADVYVGATRGVKDWMLKQPAVLRPHEVIELASAASKPATWIEREEPVRREGGSSNV
jgi:hypothetical protein